MTPEQALAWFVHEIRVHNAEANHRTDTGNLGDAEQIIRATLEHGAVPIPDEPALAAIAERHALAANGPFASNQIAPTARMWDAIEHLASQGNDVAVFLNNAWDDVKALLGENAALLGLIHDMQQDGGIGQGEKQERTRMVAILERHTDQTYDELRKRSLKDVAFTEQRIGYLEVLSYVRTEICNLAIHEPEPPLPPERARQYAASAREVLRQIAEISSAGVMHAYRTHGDLVKISQLAREFLEKKDAE